ncbi:MAG: hypothetical protein ACE5K0_02165 [Candidatus Methanofastidiosia archaeon]
MRDSILKTIEELREQIEAINPEEKKKLLRKLEREHREFLVFIRALEG